MTALLALISFLVAGWLIRKQIAGKPSPQREEPRSIPFDQERPRALSYTEMMNSGQQRVVRTPKDNEWYLS
jgi:hypothetical protein